MSYTEKQRGTSLSRSPLLFSVHPVDCDGFCASLHRVDAGIDPYNSSRVRAQKFQVQIAILCPHVYANAAALARNDTIDQCAVAIPKGGVARASKMNRIEKSWKAC